MQKKSQEIQKVVSSTRIFVTDVDKKLNSLKANLPRIAKEKQSVRKTIADFRKKVNKSFDDLEKNSLAELDHTEQTILSRIDKDKKYLETTKSKGEDFLKQIESFKGDNECDLFVQVKTGLQFLNDAVESIRVLTAAEENLSIQFEIDRNIEEYISSLKSFGLFLSTDVMAIPAHVSAIPFVKTSSLPTQQQSQHVVQYSTYKIQKCETFDVKEESDTNTCHITSICQLPDDTFLFTDWSNNNLIRLDQSFKQLDSVKLPGAPHSVCAAGSGQAAVSLVSDRKIQLVSVGKKLTLTRSFDVCYKCRGIAYVGNYFIVCSCINALSSLKDCIQVYNNGGQLQYTIQRDQQRAFSVASCVTVSDDSKHLLVTSLDRDVVIMLDLSGNVTNTFTHKDLKGPRGICSDGKGQVFVCGFNSNTVVQLSPKQQKIEVILREKDGMIKPYAVYYDRKQSRLLVSCEEKNELLSFTLK